MGGAIRTAGFPVFFLFFFFTNGRDNNKQLFSHLPDNIQMSLSDVISHFVTFLIFTDLSFKNKLFMALSWSDYLISKQSTNAISTVAIMSAPSIPSNHRTHSTLLTQIVSIFSEGSLSSRFFLPFNMDSWLFFFLILSNWKLLSCIAIHQKKRKRCRPATPNPKGKQRPNKKVKRNGLVSFRRDET